MTLTITGQLVGITSQSCKVMERIIRKKLLQHLEENNLLSLLCYSD